MESIEIARKLRKRTERINLRMRINNQVKDTKEDLVACLMKKHNLSDFDKGLMLLSRCLNDVDVKNFIITVSQSHLSKG
jgi:hypothetical protein